MRFKFVNCVIASVFCMSSLPAFAAEAIASAPLDCSAQKAQVNDNREKIKQAFAKGD